jgi:hypothetical protein
MVGFLDKNWAKSQEKKYASTTQAKHPGPHFFEFLIYLTALNRASPFFSALPARISRLNQWPNPQAKVC